MSRIVQDPVRERAAAAIAEAVGLDRTTIWTLLSTLEQQRL